ncbi:MAG: dihydroxy-acid dehydratase [Gammaproteobacteria bacterium]|nr:dihydroxy-acid dehydratase [Gammaproteobacteria bacterium]NIM73107.1 dihydroxy-acid dehydratase [Gammaproteobacteria bacterium]NIN38787.1 dihydroxy-acid dehydratase [Gammaproteobacteria bacterium]NIO24862.1 dihydroxy-acid dehydratase [Gammaproteobacteria bacterium]NIO65464.1 dihydroxy-acid dehydratase [Gammaproteobacteria bacterium]
MSEKKQGMRRKLTDYGDAEFSLYLRKAFIKAMGFSEDALARPVIGIANTASAYNACHATVPELVEAVKRGVMLAGGLPMEFPTISLHESFAYPTSMYLRNLMSMDTEEMMRALPMDACVLIGGCDKTVPAQLMAAASVDIPSIVVVTGPMLSGTHRGERVCACTDCRRFWADYRAGRIDEREIEAVTDRLVSSAGTCGVMGTASTMACMTEAMGMMLPGGATIPAVHADRLRHAEQAGARALGLAGEDLRPSRIMTGKSLANALRVLLAVGGSTNGVLHLTAIAGRLGIRIDMEAFDRMGNETPVLIDLKPTGSAYMDDLHAAGGMATVLRELAPLLHQDCMTVTGRSLGKEIAALPPAFDQGVVRPLSNPIHTGGGIAFLRGNLSGDGAIIKQSACSEELLVHSGRAVVFDSLDDLAARIDDPSLDVSADDVLVLRNAGPKGAPGMPEAGYIPIPKKLAQQGVRDMVRISDCRMSGTAFGTIVLHASPEAAVGGPLALVRNGDAIRLDVPARRLSLEVADEELERRRQAWRPDDRSRPTRGYGKLFFEHVTQADEGCDFDFLTRRPFEGLSPD